MKKRKTFAFAVLLLTAGCGRQAPVAVLPPPEPPTRLLEAEAAFRTGDYRRADDLYLEMSQAPGEEREIALARRAFIHALPGTVMHDPTQATEFLDQLAEEFPASLRGTEAQAVLSVLPGIDELRRTGEARLGEIETLEAALEEIRREREGLGTFLDHAFPGDPEFDAERARADYRALLAARPGSVSRRAMERILFLLAQWERLNAVDAGQEERLATLALEVQTLRAELDRLKEIDLGRRLPN